MHEYSEPYKSLIRDRTKLDEFLFFCTQLDNLSDEFIFDIGLCITADEIKRTDFEEQLKKYHSSLKFVPLDRESTTIFDETKNGLSIRVIFESGYKLLRYTVIKNNTTLIDWKF